MTAKELLESKGTSTVNVVDLMEEYAKIKVQNAKDMILLELSSNNRFEQLKKKINKLNLY